MKGRPSRRCSTPEGWLDMQDLHDLWVARQHVNRKRVSSLRVAAGQPLIQADVFGAA
jgi:plasmid maintenance system antidote protein VapI